MSVISVSFVQGEAKPLFLTEVASVGTVSFNGSGGFTLYDAYNNPVSGFTALIPVQSPSPASTVTAFIEIDSTNLTPGAYTGVMTLPIVAQDGILRVAKRVYTIYVRPQAG